MEWISVEDGLPDAYNDGDRNYVLVYGGGEYLYTSIWQGYYEDGWYVLNNGDYYDGGHGRDYNDVNITHWMPLPDPPQ